MRISKPLIYANVTALSLNGIILLLMAMKKFPPLLGIVAMLLFLAASVWLSCKANGVPPKRAPKYPFHSAPTEQMERI